jgi:hypothetical protein
MAVGRWGGDREEGSYGRWAAMGGGRRQGAVARRGGGVARWCRTAGRGGTAEWGQGTVAWRRERGGAAAQCVCVLSVWCGVWCRACVM